MSRLDDALAKINAVGPMPQAPGYEDIRLGGSPQGERVLKLEGQAAATPDARLGTDQSGMTAREHLARVKKLVGAAPLHARPAYARMAGEETPNKATEAVGAFGMGGASVPLGTAENAFRALSMVPGASPAMGASASALGSANRELFQPYREEHPWAYMGGQMAGQVPAFMAGGSAVGAAGFGKLAGGGVVPGTRIAQALADMATAGATGSGSPVERGIQIGTAGMVGPVLRGVGRLANWAGRKIHPRLAMPLGRGAGEAFGPRAAPAEVPPPTPPIATPVSGATNADLGVPEGPQIPPLDPHTEAARAKVMAIRAKAHAGEREAHTAAHSIRDQLPDEVFQPHPDVHPETGEEIPHPLEGTRIRDVWDGLVDIEAKLKGKPRPHGTNRLKVGQALENELGLPGRMAEGEDPEVIAQDIADAYMSRFQKLQKRGGGGGEGSAGTSDAPPGGEPPSNPLQDFGDAMSVGPDGVQTTNVDMEMVGADGRTHVIPAGTAMTPENLAKIRSSGSDFPSGAAPEGGWEGATSGLPAADVPRGTPADTGSGLDLADTQPTGGAERYHSLASEYSALSHEAKANPDVWEDPAWAQRYNEVENSLYEGLSPHLQHEGTMAHLDELAGAGAPPGAPAASVGSLPQTTESSQQAISQRLSQFTPKQEQVAHQYAQAMHAASIGDEEGVMRASVLEKHLRGAMEKYGWAPEEQDAFLGYLQSRGSTGLPAAPRGTTPTPLQSTEGAAPGRETSAAPGRINDPVITSKRLFHRDVADVVSLLDKLGTGGKATSRFNDLAARRAGGGDEKFAAEAHKMVQDLVRTLDTKRSAKLSAALKADPKAAKLVDDALAALRVGAGKGGRPRGGGGRSSLSQTIGAEKQAMGLGRSGEVYEAPSIGQRPQIQKGGSGGGEVVPFRRKPGDDFGAEPFGQSFSDTPSPGAKRIIDHSRTIPVSPDPTPALTGAERRMTPRLPPDMEGQAFGVGHQILMEGTKTPDLWKSELNRRMDGAFTPEQLDHLWTQMTGKHARTGVTQAGLGPGAGPPEPTTPSRPLPNRSVDTSDFGIPEGMDMTGNIAGSGSAPLDASESDLSGFVEGMRGRPITADYGGYQPGNAGGTIPGYHTWHPHEDLQGLPSKARGVSEHALRKLGYEPPPPPAKK